MFTIQKRNSRPADAVGVRGCPPRDVLEVVPRDVAVDHGVLPLGIVRVRGSDALEVACAEGGEADAVRIVRFVTGMTVRPSPLPAAELRRRIHEAYSGDGRDLGRAVHSLAACEPAKAAPPDRSGTSESEVTRFVSALLDHAVAVGASDVHVVPGRDGTRIRVRIDSKLLAHDEPVCGPGTHQRIVNRIKVLAGLDVTCRGKPQDGRLSVSTPAGVVPGRVSVLPTVHGEKVVVRLLRSGVTGDVGGLGLDPFTTGVLLAASARTTGAVLVAGPTGGGKSTTLYALATRLAAAGRSVVTAEDPVERYLDGVSQTDVDEARGLGYSEILRGLLRQDPDVILLGEIRDEASAVAACRAAATGHLLLSSVHGSDVPGVFRRLAGLGVPPADVAAAVSAVTVQRLVPALCGRCKVIDLASSNRLEAQVFRGVGCPSCDHAGYAGVVPLNETLVLTPEVRDAVSAAGPVWRTPAGLGPDLYRAASDAAEDLLRAGTISAADFQRVVGRGPWNGG